jgi:ABC-type uncharacterized transport system ATPase subunit
MSDQTRSQDVLRQLADQATVAHFELVKPSLHDIFIQIARPEHNGQASAN